MPVNDSDRGRQDQPHGARHAGARKEVSAVVMSKLDQFNSVVKKNSLKPTTQVLAAAALIAGTLSASSSADVVLSGPDSNAGSYSTAALSAAAMTSDTANSGGLTTQRIMPYQKKRAQGGKQVLSRL